MRISAAKQAGRVSHGPEGPAGVDDNDRIGGAPERRLHRSSEYRFVSDYSTTDSALRAFGALQPGIILLDVDIPGFDSLELLGRLAAEVPESRVILVSGHAEPEFIERALDAGAAGYILKDDGIPEGPDLIRQAASGELVLSPTARTALRGAAGLRVPPPPHPLPARSQRPAA